VAPANLNGHRRPPAAAPASRTTRPAPTGSRRDDDERKRAAAVGIYQAVRADGRRLGGRQLAAAVTEQTDLHAAASWGRKMLADFARIDGRTGEEDKPHGGNQVEVAT
jgi:hypothetical protein